MSDLIKRLRMSGGNLGPRSIPDEKLRLEAADRIEQLEAQYQSLLGVAEGLRAFAQPAQLAAPDRRVLQAEGKHPAPCARYCEANAFQIEIRNLKGQLAAPVLTECRHCGFRVALNEAPAVKEDLTTAAAQPLSKIE